MKPSKRAYDSPDALPRDAWEKLRADQGLESTFARATQEPPAAWSRAPLRHHRLEDLALVRSATVTSPDGFTTKIVKLTRLGREVAALREKEKRDAGT